MLKILTPVNLGSFALAHRVVTLVTSTSSSPPSPDHVSDIATGGLVIQSFLPDRSAPAAAGNPPAGEAWRNANSAIRRQGGASVARVDCGWLTRSIDYEGGPEASSHVPEWSSLAQQCGFDGVELDGCALPPTDLPQLFLEMAREMAKEWGPERLGVSLAPFSWMAKRDDMVFAEFYKDLIAALVEMEVAYIRLTSVYTPDRGNLATSPLGKEMRRACTGLLIASGEYPTIHAIAAVESRWADAITFSANIENGTALLASISRNDGNSLI